MRRNLAERFAQLSLAMARLLLLPLLLLGGVAVVPPSIKCLATTTKTVVAAALLSFSLCLQFILMVARRSVWCVVGGDLRLFAYVDVPAVAAANALVNCLLLQQQQQQQ